MATEIGTDSTPTPSQGEPPSAAELNSWRRGFTPQAEIWNGRMAMLSLVLGLSLLLVIRLLTMN
ncbi:MAG: high light inducible protein [Prochlorococcus sp.]|nr:high light inducible protein [Prochlorococcaceae cyanobacterium Fu_MAG_50]